jgi:hypothetical protein
MRQGGNRDVSETSEKRNTQDDSLARGPKLLSINNYVFEIMT